MVKLYTVGRFNNANGTPQGVLCTTGGVVEENYPGNVVNFALNLDGYLEEGIWFSNRDVVNFLGNYLESTRFLFTQEDTTSYLGMVEIDQNASDICRLAVIGQPGKYLGLVVTNDGVCPSIDGATIYCFNDGHEGLLIKSFSELGIPLKAEPLA